jgi:hypothetical protein
VFGLSLYSFWWTTLLLYGLAFWNSTGRVAGWRIAGILVAGLSSPAITLAAPVFAYNAFKVRKRGELIAAIVAVGCAVVQTTELIQSHQTGVIHLSVDVISASVGKLVGGISHLESLWRSGSASAGHFLAWLLYARIYWRCVDARRNDSGTVGPADLSLAEFNCFLGWQS